MALSAMRRRSNSEKYFLLRGRVSEGRMENEGRPQEGLVCQEVGRI